MSKIKVAFMGALTFALLLGLLQPDRVQAQGPWAG